MIKVNVKEWMTLPKGDQIRDWHSWSFDQRAKMVPALLERGFKVSEIAKLDNSIRVPYVEKTK